MRFLIKRVGPAQQRAPRRPGKRDDCAKPTLPYPTLLRHNRGNAVIALLANWRTRGALSVYIGNKRRWRIKQPRSGVLRRQRSQGRRRSCGRPA